MNKLFCLLILLAVMSGCKRESALPTLQPDEFTTAQREQLGARMKQAIAENPQLFPIKENSESKDSALYAYLQWQYDQAAYFLHFNNTSSPEQQWNPNLSWEIHIVDSPQPFALTIPGGNHYISVSLLQQLQGADQLFSLFALELSRMQHRYSFYKLIERFGTNRILELIKKGETTNGVDPMDLINELMSTIYDAEIVQRLDQQTIDLICKSSIFNPIALLFTEIHFQEINPDWIDRKSYSGRATLLNNLLETAASGCGTRGDLGDYQKWVLDNL